MIMVDNFHDCFLHIENVACLIFAQFAGSCFRIFLQTKWEIDLDYIK